MAPSKMDDFISLIGGEHNLPVQLEQLPAVDEAHTQSTTTTDPDELYNRLDHVVEYRSAGSTNTATPPPPRKTTSAASPPLTPSARSIDVDVGLDPHCGQPAPLGLSFCPWQPVSRFCYRFVKREWQQPLASAFFDGNKIWDREWDLCQRYQTTTPRTRLNRLSRYYIYSDQSPTVKPIVLVLEHEFQVVLDDINKQFPEAKVAITDSLRAAGFVLDFDELRPEHRPRFLGRSTSRTQHEHWVKIGPVMTQTSDNMGQDRSLQAFKDKMALIAEISKNKNKEKRALAHQDRLLQRAEMTKQTLRAQRYLGLLPKQDQSLESSMASITLAAINPSAPSPFPFDQEPIIIAFDVEAWENSPNPITEVGIATLDTRDLRGIAPGRVGEEWQKHIRARHFRINEYKSVKNHRFVQGCPADFRFGKSEFVNKNQMVPLLSSCFKHPFNKVTSAAIPSPNDIRNVILLGHDISQDIKYLSQLGFNVTNRANVLEAMDTTVMYRAYTHDPNSRSLGAILVDFDLTGWHLHNAGNDAVYTLKLEYQQGSDLTLSF
nr:putative nucleolar protein c2c4.08 [Quercus suber]